MLSPAELLLEALAELPPAALLALLVDGPVFEDLSELPEADGELEEASELLPPEGDALSEPPSDLAGEDEPAEFLRA